MALGPELVTNGGFTGDADGWSFGDSGSYGSNDAIMFNSGGPLTSLSFYQPLPTIEDGITYRV